MVAIRARIGNDFIEGTRVLGEKFNQAVSSQVAGADPDMTLARAMENAKLAGCEFFYGDTALVPNPSSHLKYSYEDPPGTPLQKLRLKGRTDDMIANERRMNVAVPDQPVDLVATGDYLGELIDALKGGDSPETRQFLLATIFFRRCR